VTREVSRVSEKSQSRLKNKVFLSKTHLTEILIYFHIFNVAVGGKGEKKIMAALFVAGIKITPF